MKDTILLGMAVLALATGMPAGNSPVPPETQAYVGEWKAPGTNLRIAADGSFVNQRLRTGAQPSITAGPRPGTRHLS